GERPRAADDADRAGLVDVPGHDADLALARGDDPRAVGADQAHPRLRVEEALDPGHVEDRDALGDGDDHLDPGVGGLHDRVAPARRGDEPHARAGPRLGHGFGYRVEQREPFFHAPALARRNPADHLGAVLPALDRVKRPGFAEPLADHPRVLVNEDAHGWSRLVMSDSRISPAVAACQTPRRATGRRSWS